METSKMISGCKWRGSGERCVSRAARILGEWEHSVC